VCNNSHAKTIKLPSDQKIVYHSFPSEVLRRQKWIQLCRRAGKWNPDSCTVCSVHFKPEDYVRDLKAELLNITPKKV
jgi:5-methylcytosine-specific restriction endonuclease McrA